MSRMIKDYAQETDFVNSGAGTATWCIASKDGKKYFIKSFLEITLLDEETAKNLPAPMVEAKRKSCVQFRIRKKRLYDKLNEIQNGIFISPKELFIYNGHFCAVTDYIESFEGANKIHKYSPRRKAVLMRTLVLALKDLSDNHIVHSDLKLDNIIITYNQKKKPQLKIIDFDSGFFEDASPHNVSEYHGDMVYFAPESMVFLQAEGESDIRLTCAVDKFAMGLILHQMWCGKLPEYDKNECANVAEAVLLDKPITLHGSIPPQLQTIIKGFLQEDPDKRMNYDQAYSLLGALLETLSEDDPEVELEKEPPKPPKKRNTANVNVICIDTKGDKVIHSTTLTIEAGHEFAVVPKEIEGYKCLDEKCLIRVDANGHADHSTIKFNYTKKTNKAWIWIIIAIGIGLLVWYASTGQSELLSGLLGNGTSSTHTITTTAQPSTMSIAERAVENISTSNTKTPTSAPVVTPPPRRVAAATVSVVTATPVPKVVEVPKSVVTAAPVPKAPKLSSSANIIAIDASSNHTVVLRKDGTVVAVGCNDYDSCNTKNWKQIIEIAGGDYYTVGLKANGTVVAVGDNTYGQCNVSSWRGIISVAALSIHTVGLKQDGTVVAVGSNQYGQCNVGNWKDIIAIAAGYAHTVGIKKNGTVVIAGYEEGNLFDVREWKDIIAVAAGGMHIVGLKKDGTVVAAGWNHNHQCDVKEWKDIVAIAAAGDNTVGLKKDGTVVVTGSNKPGQENVKDWKNIVAIDAGGDHIVGLREDGIVVTVGSNEYGKCNVQAQIGVSTSTQTKKPTATPTPTNKPTAAPKPTAVPIVKVNPYSYETQYFSKGTKGKVANMFDDNIKTYFQFFFLQSERTDNIPEITVYFNGETIGRINIRNGYLKGDKNYFSKSRLKKLTIKVYQYSGKCNTFTLDIPDQYTTDYKELKFPQSYDNVSRIEFYIYWNGYDKDDLSGMTIVPNGGYQCHIFDLSFYSR